MDRKPIVQYLKLLGMPLTYEACCVDCEICDSKEKITLLSKIKGPSNETVSLPVMGCNKCGHIFQSIRFSEKFYQDYYDKFYRIHLQGDSFPAKDFFLDQIKRGYCLYKSLQRWLPKKGRLLDIGCSSGGLMVPFQKKGWEVKGNDPDSAYAKYGKKFGLSIETVSAEEISLDKKVDLIIINGSLEHVYDINKVMKKCHQLLYPEGLLLVEGRALGYGMQLGYLSHNHRRFLSSNAIELLMLKYNLMPIHSTNDELCGSTRPGATFVLARATNFNANVYDDKKKESLEKLHSHYIPYFEKLGLE